MTISKNATAYGTLALVLFNIIQLWQYPGMLPRLVPSLSFYSISFRCGNIQECHRDWYIGSRFILYHSGLAISRNAIATGTLALFLFYRCGNIQECYRDWYIGSSDDDKCRQLSSSTVLTYYFECSYCCIKDGCNIDLHPKQDTLYMNIWM